MPRLRWLATIAAVMGAGVWFAGLFLAVHSFDQNNAIPYSPWNHFMSELGFPYASRQTWLYNGALFFGSMALLCILLALAVHLRTKMGYVAAGFGFASCVALNGIGWWGLKQDYLQSAYYFLPFLRIHSELTFAFFLGWLVTVALFTIVFCFRWRSFASRLMAIIGVACCLLYPVAIFVAVHDPVSHAMLSDLKKPGFVAFLKAPAATSMLTPWIDSHRPHIWWLAVMEWILAFSVLFWHGGAWFFLWMETGKKGEKPSTNAK